MRERLTCRDVLDASFALLEEGGLDAVSLRAAARRLDVRPTSVVFQVGTRERLRELMADEVVGGLRLAGLPDRPDERVVEVCRRLRHALLAHRDGARLVTGTTVWEQHTVAVSEVVVGALLDGGADPTTAGRTALCLEYLVLGLVQEEQAVTTGEPPAEDRYAGSPALGRVRAVLEDDDFAARLDLGAVALVRHATAAGTVGVPASAPRDEEGR